MYNISLLLRTLSHLKPKQLLYQITNRLSRPKFHTFEAEVGKRMRFPISPIKKPVCFSDEKFTFLNLSSSFLNWNDNSKGNLWCYNLNYMDWLWQDGLSCEEGEKWIDKFIADIGSNALGLDPYPTALRTINWIKFFSKYPEAAIIERENSLYSQLLLLKKRLEYHLLGNHLLEDAYSLYIGAVYFGDKKLQVFAENLLQTQLEEQILADGAHYEQSPMYHCILLDRLLDCINICSTCFLRLMACKMLGHLESIVWKDGTIPMLNDSANGIAPLPTQLYDYAKKLGLKWNPIPLSECGYRRFSSDLFDVIIDVGNITCSYQPGHSHADTFNYELRQYGQPIVVDTGISTYNKNEQRQYERSTKAHNTVVVEKDSSEVWGGFRIGRQCKVRVLHDEINFVEAVHNGFTKPCYRTFKVENGVFIIEDKYAGEATSYIHLAHGIDPTSIRIEGATSIDIIDTRYSLEYNSFISNKTIVINFTGSCRYIIS